MRTDQQSWTRGALARLLGCNLETIRYYENIGLMPPAARTARNYRIYGEEARKRLGFILRLRGLGFGLEDIRSLLRLVESGNYSCAQINALTAGHMASIRTKIRDLQKLNRALQQISKDCDKGETPHCPILDALGAP